MGRNFYLKKNEFRINIDDVASNAAANHKAYMKDDAEIAHCAKQG